MIPETSHCALRAQEKYHFRFCDPRGGRTEHALYWTNLRRAAIEGGTLFAVDDSALARQK
jgi:hypothetical protein